MGINSFARSADTNLSSYSPIALSTSKKKFGFTLAEVLITLGIIGVVAALIMPSLINKIQDKALEVKREKAASTLINAWNQTAANEGYSLVDYDMSARISISNSDIEACGGDNACLVNLEIKNLISIYVPDGLKIIRQVGYESLSSGSSGMPSEYTLKTKSGNVSVNLNWDNALWFVTEDGVWYMATDISDGYYDDYRLYIVDVNGPKKPNAIGKDVFSITGAFYNHTIPLFWDNSKIKDSEMCRSAGVSNRHNKGGWFSEDEVDGGLCFYCDDCF